METKIPRIVLVIFLLSIQLLTYIELCAQADIKTDTTIIGLSGMEDEKGNTYLLYQIQQKVFSDFSDTTFLHYYYYDLGSNSVRKLFNSYKARSKNSTSPIFQKLIVGFYFFNNEIEKYICLYISFSQDTNATLLRVGLPNELDNLELNIGNGFVKYMQVVDDTIWINFNDGIYYSSDYVVNWIKLNKQSNDFNFFSIYPFNSNIFFGYDNKGRLWRTTN